jgi:glucan 1,3-beta-glucosidase
VKDYGAKGDGRQDDFPFIQMAIIDGSRCGSHCNATSTKGAVVYFPPGTYKISRPLLQYYFTSFIGDPVNRPVIQPTDKFEGIALIDTDFYDPAQRGNSWYWLFSISGKGC